MLTTPDVVKKTKIQKMQILKGKLINDIRCRYIILTHCSPPVSHLLLLLCYNYLMADLVININKNKIRIVLDRKRWERLANDLGLYNDEFIKSVKKGLRDYKKKKIYKLKDLNV